MRFTTIAFIIALVAVAKATKDVNVFAQVE